LQRSDALVTTKQFTRIRLEVMLRHIHWIDEPGDDKKRKMFFESYF